MATALTEVETYSKLESVLYGAMIHALGVSAPILHASASAVRIFDGPDRTLSTYLHTNGLAVNPNTVPLLLGWPTQEESIFEWARLKQLTDDTFHYQPLAQGIDFSADPFGPFESIAEVVDAIGVSFPLPMTPAWCMMVYIRCAPHDPFGDHELNILKQLKPALARVVTGGYRREVSGFAHSAYLPALHGPASNLTPADLLAKLSRTERLILKFLRTESTEKQIAEIIHRSPHTIHVHVKNIYRKLGINSRRMLTALLGQAH